MLREGPNRRECVGWLEDMHTDVCVYMYVHVCTVNREYFIGKIFLDSLTCAKIKYMYVHTSNNDVVTGSFVRKLKIIARNILSTKYSEFTVEGRG